MKKTKKTKMKLNVLSLEWAQIRDVPAERRALHFALCFMISELNVLGRLQILSPDPADVPAPLKAAAQIQKLTMIRILTGKCHEFGGFLKRCAQEAEDELVKAKCKAYAERFGLLGEEEGKGRRIARHVRNKMAFHLDFETALTGTEIAKANANADGAVDCNLYVADEEGNSFFPAGEHVIFESGLMNAPGDEGHSIRSEEDLKSWIDWAFSVVDLAGEMHHEVFRDCILKPTGRDTLPTVSFPVPGGLVARKGKDFLPLFLVGNDESG